MISIKGREIVGFFCRVILTWKLGSMFETQKKQGEQKELVFREEISIYIYRLENYYTVITKKVLQKPA